MSSLETRKIEPASSTTVTLGEAGDTVTAPTGAIVKTNTVKDSGGNTLFTSDGAGTLSSVNSAIAGSMIFISSQTASTSSSVSFTSGIDSTYDEYMFVFVNIKVSANSASFSFNGSIDGGSNYNLTKTTTYFRAYHYESDGGAALGYNTGRDLAQSTAYQNLCVEVLNEADASACGILHLFSPASTTYVKQFYSTASYCDYNVGEINSFVSGYGNTTSAVDAISFNVSSGTFDGTIYLYGIS